MNEPLVRGTGTMSYKGAIRRLCEKLTGTTIKVFRDLPRGIDPFDDLANYLPKLRVRTVFDVGANIGQSADIFQSRFPASTIYCFEPVEDTFRQLQSSFRANDRVFCFRLAVSSSKGAGKMVLSETPEMKYLAKPLFTGEAALIADLEDVETETVDGFCGDRGIDSIDFLKIDTEGHDLEVLKGTERLLAEQCVDVVEVEAGMNIENKRHVGFADIDRFLQERDYFLFGIYEQVNEWPNHRPHLRRTNPIYISRRVIEANTAN
jgi:FkbM family methyltransferase